MKRTKIRIIKKRIRNLIFLGILLLCIITAYKIYPLSKSEKIITTNISYIDSISKESLNLIINTDDYDSGYYFILPNNINGMQVLKYCAENNSDINYQPGDKYYLSQEEIDTTNINLNVVYNTKESNENYLYYKKLETTIEQTLVKIEGYMPKDSDINIK